MMKVVERLALGTVFVTSLGACGLLGGEKKSDEKTAATAAGATASASTTAAKVDGATSPAAQTAPPMPAGRTPIPTLDEWASMREVTVKGSSALNCETKMVREYLRISCRGKNDTGGTPTTLRVIKGGHDVSTFAAGGITSAVLPYTQGIDTSISFSWTDKSHVLNLKWPRGAPKPVVLGVFEGAKSPLDGSSTAALDAKLCECHKKVFSRPSCEDNMSLANADCAATYGADCGNLLACSRGEPGATPKCPAEHRLGPMNVCHKKCGGADKSCPAGQRCEEQSNFFNEPVCWPN